MNDDVVSIYDDNVYSSMILRQDTLVKNPIAITLFSSNENNITPYTKDIGKYSTIFGFMATLYIKNTNQEVHFFTKHIGVQSAQKSRVINLFSLKDDTFTTIDHDIVFFSRKFDVLNYNDQLFIKNQKTYNTYFGFGKILDQKAFESFKKLKSKYDFWFPEDKIDSMFFKLSNKNKKKLINSLDENNPVLIVGDYAKIKRQIKRICKKELQLTPQNKILIDTPPKFIALIRVLNSDLGYNYASKQHILADSKTIIKKKAKLKKG